MSYDLFLSSPKVNKESFNQYFSSRQYYEFEGEQAWYSNDDSGVYFSFELNSVTDEDDDFVYDAAFNMNFFRPHFFALEAEPEVCAFIQHFECEINDPQNEGMNQGPYSPEGFIRGWNTGNEFSFKAILNMPDYSGEVLAKPTVEIEKIWSWNKKRAYRDNELVEDLFIPKIMYGKINGDLKSFCVWPDGISTIIPKTDFLYIPRKDLAPKSGWFKKGEEDFCLVPFEEALPSISQYSNADYELPVFKLPAPDTPKFIKDFVKGLKKFEGEVEGVAADSVLNKELAESAAN